MEIFSSNFNGSMSAKFFTNSKTIFQVPSFDEGMNFFNFDIDLPTNLNIFIDGKDKLIDTVVDEHGKIIMDKFLRIDEIQIDGKPVDKNAIHKIVKMTTNEGETIVSNYIGFNGIVSIDLNYEDSLVAHLNIEQLLGKTVEPIVDLN